MKESFGLAQTENDQFYAKWKDSSFYGCQIMEEIIFMRRLITTDEYFIVGDELLSTHFTHEIFLYTLAFRF